MSDEKYSIDDILKEIDTSREKNKNRRTFDGSVTDILGEGDEIERLIRSGRQQNKTRNMSVTEVISTIPSGKQREPVKSARQLTEKESETRIASDISNAVDAKRSAPRKSFAEREALSAKQLTEKETEARIARDIANAADMKRYEELTGSRGEDDGDVKRYTPENSVSDDSQEIELHDAKTFVPSDTMEMRRMQKINDIKDAMLKFDSEAETPDEMLDSLNPMESRAKAAEQLKAEEDTDTLAVSGNELKAIGKGEERIKEYTPSASRKRERSEDAAPARQTPFTGELHVGESIMDALNKKINEQSSDFTLARELNLPHPPSSDDESAPIEQESENNEELEKIRQANELAQKKKRKLAEFILDGRDDTSENDTVDEERSSESELIEDEEEEVPIDLNDEEVIRDRLSRASKGLWGRLVILAVLMAATLFIAFVNIFRIKIGRIGNMISYVGSPENYLYAHLAIGILSFAACSSVVSNGFSRLFKGRPDGDTLCALSHMGALIATIPYLLTVDYIQRGFSQVYLAMSLGSMIFNTISKILTVKTAQANFDFVFGKSAKHFIERCEGNGAEQLAKGAVEGMPAVASIRKTEMLCDFIVSTYCEDASDRTSRKIAPIALIAAVIGGVIAYFTCSATIMKNHPSWAATVSSLILSLSASFSCSLTVTLPMYLTARRAGKRGSAILGYEAAEEMSETNAVLADAKMLFPADSIKIVNICGYDTPKTRGEGKINIDEAIIYAASLAVASDSVMSDALFHILNFKKELLKPVSGCVYENNLGVMGWIDRRRVLLGTRAHMKAHEITVPNTKKESAANKNNDEVIYLAVGGEVCLLFFVRPIAAPEITRSVRALAARDVSMVVKTVDGMVTAPVIARVFGIDEAKVRILPYELHETFEEHTKFVSNGSAAVTSDGSFSSLADTVCESRVIRGRAAIGNIMQMIGVALGIIVTIIFTLLTNEEQLIKFNLFNLLYVLLFNTAWSLLTLAVPFIKRR